MAIILPEAEWRPFSGKSTTALQHDILCAHTEVGSNEGSISWGAQAGNPYAHCYTACGGKTVQCQDLKYRSAAVLEGNPYAICWETEDTKSACFADWDHTCGNVPAWTEAQVQRLIKDMAWCCVKFDIPPVLIPDTKVGRRGLGYHRQGVPGSPEWVTGSLAWTKWKGKCCPDWMRIEQFKTRVVPGVRNLVIGGVLGGFLMALSDADQDRLYQRLIRIEKALANGGFLGNGDNLDPTLGQLAQLDRAFVEDRGAADVRTAIADQLIDIGLARSGEFQALEAKVDEILARLPAPS
jgi:hypothetical protein